MLISSKRNKVRTDIIRLPSLESANIDNISGIEKADRYAGTVSHAFFIISDK